MSTDEIDNILARQSVELLDAMQRGEPGAAENLAKWLKQSRRHTKHYLMTVAFERELNQVEFDPQLQIGPPSPPLNVVTLEQRSNPVAGLQPRERGSLALSSRRRRAGWIAASIAAGMAMLGVLSWHGHRNEYVTAVGEQRAVALEDGSVIHLNTQSRVVVRFSDRGRDIDLLAGEALFKVHRDAARPFRVHTSEAVIQALGTQFNVYRRPEGTTVAVLEGRVTVMGEVPTAEKVADIANRDTRETKLGSGQQVRIDHQGRIAARETKDVASVAAWRQRRLIFSGTPLPEIVAEFNRYNRTPQIVLEIADASKRVYSGVFDADDPESLAELLTQKSDFVIARRAGEIVIQARH